MQSEVIYLTRVGDKVNYSGTNTWLLVMARGTVQMYSVAMLRGHFLLFSSSLSSLPSSVSLLSMVRLEATYVCCLRELVVETPCYP